VSFIRFFANPQVDEKFEKSQPSITNTQASFIIGVAVEMGFLCATENLFNPNYPPAVSLDHIERLPELLGLASGLISFLGFTLQDLEDQSHSPVRNQP